MKDHCECAHCSGPSRGCLVCDLDEKLDTLRLANVGVGLALVGAYVAMKEPRTFHGAPGQRLGPFDGLDLARDILREAFEVGGT